MNLPEFERHSPEEWTDKDGNRRLTCECGHELPCPRFGRCNHINPNNRMMKCDREHGHPGEHMRQQTRAGSSEYENRWWPNQGVGDKNPGAASRSSKEWRKAHPGYITKYMHAWRKAHPDVRNAQRKINYAKGRKWNRRSWQRWDPRDEQTILNPGTFSDRELASIIGRSVQAIQVKRAKLKAGN